MDVRAKTQYWFELILDFISLVISNVIAFVIFMIIIPKIGFHPLGDWVRFYGLLFLSFLIVFFGFHKNINLHKRDRISEIENVIKNNVPVYLLFLSFLLFTKNPIFDSRIFVLSAAGIFCMISTIGRYFLKRKFTNHFSTNGSRMASYVGVITTTDRAEEFLESLKEDWSLKITGVALMDNFVENGRFFYDKNFEFGTEYASSKMKTKTKVNFPHVVAEDIPVIATDIRFLDWIRSAPLDEVFINLPYEHSDDIKDLVEELEIMGIAVHLNVLALETILDESSFDNINCKIYSGYPIATFKATEQNSTHLVIKRLFDIAIAIVGIIFSIPIIAITAIPLLIESPGPLFFKQERVGRNGRTFNIYKLRSMYKDAEKRKAELMDQNKMDGLMFKMDNDPRITKIGKIIRKLSIDELPQFFNVLRGDMSVIGTRPPTVAEFEQYESRHKRRLSMRPGITGMWQVSGRSNIQDFEEVVKLDCQYIDHWSLQLDISIFFKTIKVLLTHEGAE